MARGLKLAAMFSILAVSLLLSSMLYAAEARALNGGFPGGAEATNRVFQELSKGAIESSGIGTTGGARQNKDKYTRNAEEIKHSGPSPGDGHGNPPAGNNQ
ncbi:hypothetical protein CJ030_MR7G022695 [Morella rubra]|uniref:Uncharacterized protein n=1 Tax=Morella rubra TaxID=262757 RepID=A0A6A1V9H1_9ROSI|nr:hypothetical protein CJ030_MR7G022695 [Morella rubra]